MCAVSTCLVVACIMLRWCVCSHGDVECRRVCLCVTVLALENSSHPLSSSTDYCFFCRPLYLTSVSLGASFVHFKLFFLITPHPPPTCLSNLKKIYSHCFFFCPCVYQRCISIEP